MLRNKRSVVVDTAADLDAASAAVPEPLAAAPVAAAPGLTHLAVLAFAKRYGLKMTTKEMAAHGKRLAAKSREQGLEIIKEPHPYYDSVNTYNIDLLREHFGVTDQH
jgi:hypothetical protein